MQVCKGKSQEKVAFSFTIKAGHQKHAVLFMGHIIEYTEFNTKAKTNSKLSHLRHVQY